MNSFTYEILDSNTGSIVARDMTLDVAIIVLKSLMTEYYAHPGLSYTINRIDREVIMSD